MSSDHDLERKADSPNRKLMVPQFVRIGASLLYSHVQFTIFYKAKNEGRHCDLLWLCSLLTNWMKSKSRWYLCFFLLILIWRSLPVRHWKRFLCHFPRSFSPRSQADFVKKYLRKKLGVNKRAKHSSLSLMYWKGWNAKLSHKYEVCDSEYRNKSVVNVNIYHTLSLMIFNSLALEDHYKVYWISRWR